MISTATARLQRLADYLRQGKPMPPEDAQEIADGIEAALAGDVGLEEALGLASRSLAWSDSVETRSKLIAEISRHYHGTPTRVAKDMAFAAGQYAARTWPRYQHFDELPPFHAGKLDELFFRLQQNCIQGGARWPLGWTSIYAISKHKFAIENLSAASNNPTTHDEEL